MPPKVNILFIEDERNILAFVAKLLSGHNYKVTTATTGTEGLQLINSICPDLILLDLGLPDMDGQIIIRQVREWSDCPIIIISARTNEHEKVKALDLGADDYITKPFNPIEVSARVKSQLRRYMQLGGGTVRPDVIRVGGIELDDKEKRVMLDGEPVTLTPTEYEILKLLIQNPGQVFSPKEIYTRIWNDLPLGSENTVAVHIRHLREKLEINPAEPRYLKVVWGQGYKCEKQG